MSVCFHLLYENVQDALKQKLVLSLVY